MNWLRRTPSPEVEAAKKVADEFHKANDERRSAMQKLMRALEKSSDYVALDNIVASVGKDLTHG